MLMAEKTIKTRIQMKRGTQADWDTATTAGFKPLEGESIFYTDLNKIKVGRKDTDGNLIPLSQLNFINADIEYPNDPNLYLAGDGTWQNVTTLAVSRWPKTFEESSWSEIVSVCEQDIPTNWNIGDTKSLTIDGVDYPIVIIGSYYDTYPYTTDGEIKYAPYTFQFLDCYNVSTKNSYSPGSNSTPVWPNSKAEQVLDQLLNKMPSEVQNGIKYIHKKTAVAQYNSNTTNTKYTRYYTTSVKLFSLSIGELGESFTSEDSGNDSITIKDGDIYPYYAAGNTKIKKAGNTDTTWWLRSSGYNTSNTYRSFYVTAKGAITTDTTTSSTSGTARYLSPAFCF
jgi:hypothetical protein